MSRWEIVKLGDVCEIVSGTTPSTQKTELWDGDIKWITPAEIHDDSYYIMDTERYISEKAGLKKMPAGTVLLSSRAPIGKVAIAGVEMCCNQGFKNLICTEKIHNRYLYYFLRSKTEYLNSVGRGATFKEISKSIVENIEIPLPPLSAQCQIADRLDVIKTVIGKHKVQIENLDLLVKSRFVEMFGEPFVSNLKYDVRSIADIVKEIVSGQSIKGEERMVGPGEVAVLKVSAVTSGRFRPDEHKVILDRTQLKKEIHPNAGDLLFSRANTREYVGATCIVDKNYPYLLLPDKLWRLELRKEVLPIYLQMYMSMPSVRAVLSDMATGTSGSMYNISMEKLKKLPVSVPPVFLQERYVSFAQETNKSKFAIQKSLEELETLKKALMQQYFG